MPGLNLLVIACLFNLFVKIIIQFYLILWMCRRLFSQLTSQAISSPFIWDLSFALMLVKCIIPWNTTKRMSKLNWENMPYGCNSNVGCLMLFSYFTRNCRIYFDLMNFVGYHRKCPWRQLPRWYRHRWLVYDVILSKLRRTTSNCTSSNNSSTNYPSLSWT